MDGIAGVERASAVCAYELCGADAVLFDVPDVLMRALLLGRWAPRYEPPDAAEKVRRIFVA